MKNKLFFSGVLTSLTLCTSLLAQSASDPLHLGEISEATYNASIFADILDSCSSSETTPFTLSLRNAHEIKQSTSFLQKIQGLATRCYAHLLCRYYVMYKWLSRIKQQSPKTQNQ